MTFINQDQKMLIQIRLYQKTAVKFIECEGCVDRIVMDDVEIVRDENGTKVEFKNQKGEIEFLAELDRNKDLYTLKYQYDDKSNVY